MAKQAVATATKPSIPARIKEFYEEVMAELKKVAWPTPQEVKASTWIVAVLLLIFGVLMFTFDFLFQRGILVLLKLG